MQKPEAPLFLIVQPEDDLPVTLSQHEAEFEAQVMRAILTGREFPAQQLPS